MAPIETKSKMSENFVSTYALGADPAERVIRAAENALNRGWSIAAMQERGLLIAALVGIIIGAVALALSQPWALSVVCLSLCAAGWGIFGPMLIRHNIRQAVKDIDALREEE